MNTSSNKRIIYGILFINAIAIFISCFATAQTTYYVDIARPDNSGAGTSWAAAKKDLQVAINIASSGDQIWVKAGTYLPTHDPFANTTPSNNRDKVFSLKNGVTIYGGFAGTETLLSQRNVRSNVTILSGDLGVVNTVNDNAYHVVLSVNCTNATRLDGFSIMKGYAVAVSGSGITVGGRRIERFKGGGVSNYYSATTFANCIITENSADCTDTGDDSWGAGMDCYLSTSSIENCSFAGNSFLMGGGSFGVFGAGISIIGSGTTINKCLFYSNSSGSGFLDGSRGGALYLVGTATITNSVFYNNTASNGAALSMGGAADNTSAITNCSFVNNTSLYAGTAYSGFSKSQFRNCVFWNNSPTITSIPGRNEIYSQETMIANQPTFTNCIIRDATGAPIAVTNTTVINSLNGNPLFVSQADGDGLDNIWGTGDDGLRLQCASPAIGAGTGVTPTDDLLNLSRTTTIDIGAYEGGYTSSSFNSISSVNTTVQLVQNATGVTHYSDCSNDLVEVQSGGACTIGGTVTAKVWIETVQPSNYVKRHYEITPQQNTTTATGRVTLYFRQQEFADFNAVNTIKLPTGPADAAGIANIHIEKRGGTSSNGTGLPETYSGTIQTINNAALAISWNAAAARWEISFDVTGFSGFFVKTQVSILPLQLLRFSGNSVASCNQLQWQTADERNTKEFLIEKSVDGIAFHSLATRPAAGSGNNQYQYNDCSIASGKTFYRLKLIDNDGRFSYSSILSIDNSARLSLSIHPNPAKDLVLISSSDVSLIKTSVSVTDAAGRLVIQQVIGSFPHSLDIEKLPAGLYHLHFSNGETLKMVKEK
ncbi:T9SS type A sorting domain-containing protein [Phnomibacter ginsenosidimutans]|uniref:T9SS type A sorting domain-containing protein n=1 Tax=Phnomibacter ginsenosidimutans TaxID=2676868 RepID=A0A6I6G5N8_9BACT|nr:T9SS type A sorting domain-containing protein [Phnomibacter ginsenosidimutans]QGW27527.1 T9SS type A sorting domain-containing protein [Phnomibacter ginsenosidimutans]